MLSNYTFLETRRRLLDGLIFVEKGLSVHVQLCDHCLQDYHLYIRKMLTNREMIDFQKLDFFRFFFIILL